MKKQVLLIATILTLIISCKLDKKTTDFNKVTSDYFIDKSILNPLEATQNGQNQFNDKLQLDMTSIYRKEQLSFYKKYDKLLLGIDRKSLTDEEKNSYDIMKWEINQGKELLKFDTNLIPFDQFTGLHLTMAEYAGGESAQPFKTEKDYKNFAKRMDLYSVWLDSAVIYMKKGIEKGVVLPKALTVKIIPQFESMITEKPETNQFFTVIKKMPTTFSAIKKTEITKQYSDIITQKLMPSYKKMVLFLKNEYLPKTRLSSGIGSLPQGKQLYANYVKSWTTTTKTPDEIYSLGISEVDRIKAEMEKVKTQVGFKGTLLEFFDYVRNKPELMPFKDPKQVTDNFQKIYQIIKPNVDKLFSLQPKTAFEIRRTEAFREKTASAEYNAGALDGSRPGVFYVPIPNVKEYNYFSDEDLFLHEAIPGHHFQISLQQENKNLPDFRKYAWFGAYGEGWALYTESLGKELGLYKDPYQYFGMLSNQMHRSIRLVVDTGIHVKGWSREKAIQYSLQNEAESEASITSEIERYMATPGQALSYKIGQLKILELRKKASEKMGSKFDIKMFHQKVLESGVLPLALLENKINTWIQSN